MSPKTPEAASAARPIVEALEGFLRRGRIGAVIIAGGSKPPPPLGYLVHFPRISVTLRGTDPMLVEQEGAVRLVRPARGDAVVVPPNCWNRPNWSERALVLHLLFGRHHIGLSLVAHDGRSPEPGAAVKAGIRGEAEVPLRALAQALAELAEKCPETGPLLVEALLRGCLEALKRPPSPAAGRAAGLYESICMFVQERFQLQIGRDAVAQHFGLTPGHVSRLFRRQGAVGFSDYLTYVRIDRAKYLLKSYRQTVGEVAAACGFSDVGYFCKVFKKVAKLTPTAYRQRAGCTERRTWSQR